MDSMTLAVVGAAYGTSIAVGISRRAWVYRSRSDAFLSLVLGCGIAAILTIVLQHRSGDPSTVSLLERIESMATLSSGPALFLYVRSLRKHDALRKADVLHFFPAITAVAIPGALAVPIELLLLHQMSYTVVATFERVRNRTTATGHRLLSGVLLGVMFVIHVAQLVRLATRGSHHLVDVVPATLSIVILTGSALAIVLWIVRFSPSTARRERTVRAGLDRAGRPIAGAAGPSDVLERLDGLMLEKHIYRRVDLGLHDLAREIRVTPHQLSGALNEIAGITLLEFLARFRLEDAKRRLLDPEHDIYTIEAIGEMSGFGSRSSFHAIFRREVGTTPTRFRTMHRRAADIGPTS